MLEWYARPTLLETIICSICLEKRWKQLIVFSRVPFFYRCGGKDGSIPSIIFWNSSHHLLEKSRTTKFIKETEVSFFRKQIILHILTDLKWVFLEVGFGWRICISICGFEENYSNVDSKSLYYTDWMCISINPYQNLFASDQ